MTSMNIYSLLKEYSLETNDVRWYLSYNMAYSLLEYKNDQEALAVHIASGQLEVDLYDLEEKFIQDTQDLMDRGKIDEVNIREILNEMVLLKTKRKL